MRGVHASGRLQDRVRLAAPRRPDAGEEGLGQLLDLAPQVAQRATCRARRAAGSRWPRAGDGGAARHQEPIREGRARGRPDAAGQNAQGREELSAVRSEQEEEEGKVGGWRRGAEHRSSAAVGAPEEPGTIQNRCMGRPVKSSSSGSQAQSSCGGTGRRRGNSEGRQEGVARRGRGGGRGGAGIGLDPPQCCRRVARAGGGISRPRPRKVRKAAAA